MTFPLLGLKISYWSFLPTRLIGWSFLKAFQQEKSIEETLSHYIGDEDAVQEVVTQLEAKRFCTKHVISATEGIRTLHLYLTNKCNLTCPHCYMFAGRQWIMYYPLRKFLNL